MPDPTPVAAATKIERKRLAHFIDAAFNPASPNYVRLGKDLEDYSEELNPEIETKVNILGETSVDHKGYKPQSEVNPFYAYEGEPLFEKLCAIVNERKTSEGCMTTKVDVLLNSDGTVVWAYREDVIVVPISSGGDTSGVQIPFTVYCAGNRTAGTWNVANKTFAPNS